MDHSTASGDRNSIKHMMKRSDMKAECFLVQPVARVRLDNCGCVHDLASLLTAERGPGPRSGRAQATSPRLACYVHLAADQLQRSLALVVHGAASPSRGPR